MYTENMAQRLGEIEMKKQRQSCDTCAFYGYDEDYGAYLCDMDMDEDDYMRW